MSLQDNFETGVAIIIAVLIVAGTIAGITYGIVTVAKWAWSG